MNAFTPVSIILTAAIAVAQSDNQRTEDHEFTASHYRSVGSATTVGADSTSTLSAKYQTWTGGSTRYWRPFLRADQVRRAWAQNTSFLRIGAQLGAEAVRTYGYGYTTSSSAYHGARVVIGGLVRESRFNKGVSKSFDSALHIATAADFQTRYWVAGSPADVRHVFTGSATFDYQGSRSGSGDNTELQMDFDAETGLTCSATLLFGSGMFLSEDLAPGTVRLDAHLNNDRGVILEYPWGYEAFQFHGDMTVTSSAARMIESLTRIVMTTVDPMTGRIQVWRSTATIVNQSLRGQTATRSLFGWVVRAVDIVGGA